jgi:hypothetical protein
MDLKRNLDIINKSFLERYDKDYLKKKTSPSKKRLWINGRWVFNIKN